MTVDKLYIVPNMPTAPVVKIEGALYKYDIVRRDLKPL
jgi:hypothetical protein